MISMEEGTEKSPVMVRKQKVRVEFTENHLQKFSEFWKTVLLADENKYNVFG
jgi:hypothetical protein